MLKNLLRIPDTFEPDDRRRRQVLNVLLIVCMVVGLGAVFLAIAILIYSSDVNDSMGSDLLGVIFFGILLWMNRSPKLPAWLTGAIFVVFCLALVMQADTPAELFNG